MTDRGYISERGWQEAQETIARLKATIAAMETEGKSMRRQLIKLDEAAKEEAELEMREEAL